MRAENTLGQTIRGVAWPGFRRESARSTIACCVFLLFLASGPVRSVCLPGISYLNYARLYAASDPNVIYLCENYDALPCDGVAPLPDTNWLIDYHSESVGTFGTLGGMASVSLLGDDSGGPFPSFASIGARAGFLDEYTIGGGVGEGTLILTFEVTGSSSQTQGTSGRPQINGVPAPGGILDYANQIVAEMTPVGNMVIGELRLPIVFDQLACWEVDFYALAQIFEWLFAGQSATADYLHTAIVTAVAVEDSAGVPIPGFTIETSSGTVYTETGVILFRDSFESGGTSLWSATSP